MSLVKDFFEGGLLHAISAESPFVLIIGQDPGAGAGKAIGGLTAIVAETDDSYRKGVEFMPDESVPFPPAISQGEGGGPYLPGEEREGRPYIFGDGSGVGIRCGMQADTPFLKSLQVNVVGTGAWPDEDLEIGGMG